MIALRINGTTLPLPAGLQLTREIETTIFNREITVTDFTYPVDMPLTDEAIVALGFPNSIANTGLEMDYVADFIVDSIYVDQVVLRVLTVSLRNKTASVSVIGKYGAFAKLLNGKKLNELALGGIRTIGGLAGTVETLPSYTIGSSTTDVIFIKYKGCNSASHINSVNAGTIVTDYVFGQCIEEVSNLDTQDGMNVVNGHNYWNAGTLGVIDPVRHYLLQVVHDTIMGLTVPPARYYWCPQFRYAFLIRKCFEEFGFTVSAPLLADPKFTAIVMPNSFAINKCSYSYAASFTSGAWVGTLNVTHNATTIDPRDHVPDMPIVEFLQEVGKLFNLQYQIDLRNLTVTIVQMQRPGDFGTAVDLSAVAAPLPNLNFERQQYSRGYKFSFADTGSAEVKDDVSKFPFRGYYTLPASLAAVPSPVEKNIAMVMSENAFYQYDGVAWVFYSDNLGPYATSSAEDLQEISSKCTPLKLRRDNVALLYFTGTGTSLAEQRYDTGDYELNSYSNYGITGRGLFVFNIDRRSTVGSNAQQLAPCFYTVNPTQEAHNPGIANYLGMQQVNGWPAGTTYPQLSSCSYTNSGGFVPVYSLPWYMHNGAGYSAGLVTNFWAVFVAALAGCIEVEYELLLDAVTLNNLDWNVNVFVIDGLRFLCKKATLQLPLPGVATLQLVRV